MNASDYARYDRIRMLQDLGSMHELKREIALDRALSLPPDERLELTRHLLERYHDRIRFQYLGGLIGLLGVGGAASFMLDNQYLWLGLTGLFLTYRLCVTKSQTERSLEALLASSCDIRLIPILLKLYVHPDHAPLAGHRLRIVSLGLRRLLPRMQPDDASLWKQQQKDQLVSLLREPYSDMDLTLCILDALCLVGDENSLFIVRALSRTPTALQRLLNPAQAFRLRFVQDTAQIQQAAQRCLHAIQTRVEMRRQPRTLLRPAGPTMLAEMLVRPSLEANQDAPETLLRAAPVHPQ